MTLLSENSRNITLLVSQPSIPDSQIFELLPETMEVTPALFL
jgi:hypothetical protein